MRGRRSEARRHALLALYQWEAAGETPAVIARHFHDDPEWLAAVTAGLAGDEEAADAAAQARPDRQLFDALLRGVPERLDEIDAALEPSLDRSLKGLDPVERTILRIGCYELLFSPELPVGVILNEAIDLARAFGAEQGHRYINGVLDRVARQVRPAEVKARSSR